MRFSGNYLAKQLLLFGSARIGGSYTLASGATSDYYVDVRHAASDPTLLKTVANMLTSLTRGMRPAAYVGVALGGVSLAVACALRDGVRHLIVRSEVKEHGTGQLIEGRLPSSGRVVVVEDVATSGKSILKAVKALREAGLTVEEALVVVDREQGAETALAAEGVVLRSCVTGSLIREMGAAAKSGRGTL